MRTLVLCAVLINLVLAALAAVQTLPADGITWGRATAATDGSDLCGGVVTDCIDISSCAAVFFGPCAVGTAVKPPWGLSIYPAGLGFVEGTEFLTCANDTACALVVKVIDPLAGLNGYRDMNQVTIPEADGGGKVGYTQTGAIFGSLATAGAYIGSAWYLNNGDKKIGYNSNSFYVAGTDNEARVTRDGSTIGAPLGPYELCITAKTEAGACGAKIDFAPANLKFSVYGYTAGPDFATTVVKGQNGFPAATTHMMLRTVVNTYGIDFASIKLNGDKTLATIGSTSVTKLTMFQADGDQGGVTMDFPTKYNVGGGTKCGEATDDIKVCLPTATKTVKVIVSVYSKAAADKPAIFIDYMFDSADFMVKDKFFVYDPTIAATNPTSRAVADAAAAAAAALSTAPTVSASKMPLILVLMLCSVVIST